MGDKQYGIDTEKLNEYSQEIKKVVDKGCETSSEEFLERLREWIEFRATTWECSLR